jgi:hypothetical protein
LAAAADADVGQRTAIDSEAGGGDAVLAETDAEGDTGGAAEGGDTIKVRQGMGIVIEAKTFLAGFN